MANNHGGRRPGAGRRPNSLGAKKREAIAIVAGDPVYDGRKPRDILRSHMNWLVENNQMDEACKIASVLMPYEHARLQAIDTSVQVTRTRPAEELTDDELAAIAASSSTGDTESPEGSGFTH